MESAHSRASAQVSLVPRPFEEEEKGPGTHCLRMLRYPKNLGGLDTIVNYSASLIRIPVCDIIVHSAFELLCARVSYPQTFVFLLRFTCQYYHPRVRCEFTDNFTVSFTENMTHAQTVCTRPFLLLLKGPGDEASAQVYFLQFEMASTQAMYLI